MKDKKITIIWGTDAVKGKEKAQKGYTKKTYTFDNEEQARMFRNDKRGAETRFFTNVVQDAQDLLTQRTNRQSQEDQLRALYPYLNMYGVGNRAYGDNYFSDAQLNNLIARLKALSA